MLVIVSIVEKYILEKKMKKVRELDQKLDLIVCFTRRTLIVLTKSKIFLKSFIFLSFSIENFIFIINIVMWSISS